MQKFQIRAALFLAAAICICVLSSKNFLAFRKDDVLIPSPSISEVKKLSDYATVLLNTNGDSKVYVFDSQKEGGNFLLLGGTHPNEPASYLAAITILENLKLTKGKVFVLPRANNSAFTHNDPQEASPPYMHFNTKSGQRKFRYGSRATNPIDQWPDPDVYIHHASGQKLSGSETRNLNRAYPGRIDGNITEKIAYGIVQLIKTEDIDFTIDLHEASPEYPVINAVVASEKGMDIASYGVIQLLKKNIMINLEPSPNNLRGLSHRELGEFTNTIPLLIESSNPSQGRLRGKTDEELVLGGKDKAYLAAAKLGLLAVPYDEKGHPIELRVARHVESVVSFVAAFNRIYPEKEITMTNLPSYDEIVSSRLENFLN